VQEHEQPGRRRILGECSDSAVEDGYDGGGGDSVFVAVDDAAAQGVEAGIKQGAIFVPVHGAASVGEALTAQNVSAVLRKVGQWIGLDKDEWERISGHSARVGAAQDLLALNIDLSSVMQAGRWRDTRMPMRYGEKVLASREAMARAAKAQGRA
jgi:hypothetical protein